MMNKSKKRKNRAFTLSVFSKVLSFVFYLSAFLILFSLIMTIIVAVVKVDVNEMILPPFMAKIHDENHVLTDYELFLGNGIKITTGAENISLDDIKAVIYAGIILLTAFLLTLIPVVKFLNALIRNCINGFYSDAKNIHYISFAGFSIAIGGVIIKAATRFYNYKLITTFIEDSAKATIDFAFGFDIVYALPGIFIIILALLFRKIINSIPTQTTNSTDLIVKD